LRLRKYFELIIFLLAIVNLGLFGFLEKTGETVLLLIFGLLGLTAGRTAFKSIKDLRNGTVKIGDHIEGMLSSAIAAYTAFFVFGGYTFFESLYKTNFTILFWVLPGIIGGFAISYYRKKYSGNRTVNTLKEKQLSVSEQ
jgi:positive regulator of sigma E activity